MILMNRTAKYMLHPVSVVIFVFVLAFGMSINESAKDKKKEAVEATVIESVQAQLNIKVKCINGIEYWLYKGTSDTLMLTPKFSQHKVYPDTCEIQ
jgi:hypothetical protein